MTIFQKLLLLFLGIVLVLFVLWFDNYLNQRTFNNCKWLSEKNAFREENLKKPEWKATYDKCHSTFLNP